VSDTTAAIMTGDHELAKAELCHNLDHLGGHRSF
jgi:hypothetical protein